MNKTNRRWFMLMVALNATIVSVHSLFFAGAVFGASWEADSIRTEENRWTHEIEKWNTLSHAWERTWEERHEELYPGMIDAVDNRSYCNERGCWESNMFSFTHTSPDGVVSEVDKGSSDATWNYTQGGSWSSVNGGQVLTFSDTDNTAWESSNFGQVLVYKDRYGNSWESSNFGQVINFVGIDGTSWESSNFGQTLTNHDSSGNVWNDSNFGQVGSFKNSEGEGWEIYDTQ